MSLWQILTLLLVILAGQYKQASKQEGCRVLGRFKPDSQPWSRYLILNLPFRFLSKETFGYSQWKVRNFCFVLCSTDASLSLPVGVLVQTEDMLSTLQNDWGVQGFLSPENSASFVNVLECTSLKKEMFFEKCLWLLGRRQKQPLFIT